MHLSDELLASLFTGLPEGDQREILSCISRARDEQLQRKISPPRRRRRGADGVLRMPEEMA